MSDILLLTDTPSRQYLIPAAEFWARFSVVRAPIRMIGRSPA
jgi:hypothetical protein